MLTFTMYIAAPYFVLLKIERTIAPLCRLFRIHHLAIELFAPIRWDIFVNMYSFLMMSFFTEKLYIDFFNFQFCSEID